MDLMRMDLLRVEVTTTTNDELASSVQRLAARGAVKRKVSE
jgi:hypothetical protein